MAHRTLKEPVAPDKDAWGGGCPGELNGGRVSPLPKN